MHFSRFFFLLVMACIYNYSVFEQSGLAVRRLYQIDRSPNRLRIMRVHANYYFILYVIYIHYTGV